MTKRIRVIRNVSIDPGVDSDLKVIADRYTGGNVSRAVEMIVRDYTTAELEARPEWKAPSFLVSRSRQSAAASLEAYRIDRSKQTA